MTRGPSSVDDPPSADDNNFDPDPEEDPVADRPFESDDGPGYFDVHLWVMEVSQLTWVP